MVFLPHNGGSLSARRRRLETQWSSFIEGSSIQHAESPRRDILRSWKRSARHLSEHLNEAPADDRQMVRECWRESPLYQAAKREQSQMIQLSKEGELVAAIADTSGRLLWTFASSHMRNRAESVNFTAGGHWDEHSVGTNAVGLSLRLRDSVTVFSSEHYQPFVHDWVCYAAPIMHPQSGEIVGILDMSTTWNRHTPLGQAAVSGLARSIAQCLPQEVMRADLQIHVLGPPRILFRGKSLSLPYRQIEILCLLALNPQGLTLEQFHAALYGDNPVSPATLKAELSHLRRILHGVLGSRPYRLTLPVWGDFIEIWQALQGKRIAEAMSLYRGSLLPHSESPELREWRQTIDALMAQCLEGCDQPDLLLRKICEDPTGSELVRDRLVELMTS